MIRPCVAFDLDGVLVDADRLHFDALNVALAACGPRAVISEREHFAVYKGLPTREKLRRLVATGRMSADQVAAAAAMKQQETVRAVRLLRPDRRKVLLLRALMDWGWHIAVCSNAVRESVEAMLEQAGLRHFLRFVLSNEDAPPKPDPGMYRRAAELFGIPPERLVVVEDSAPGRRAALAAGCRLVAVEGPAEVGPGMFWRIWEAALAAKEDHRGRADAVSMLEV